ncbi:hypothetical protein PM082_015459 [Marasmius tenuissimus]|nr:hypothetical protein PM082_015459 [Marasmius tenuissimus]
MNLSLWLLSSSVRLPGLHIPSQKRWWELEIELRIQRYSSVRPPRVLRNSQRNLCPHISSKVLDDAPHPSSLIDAIASSPYAAFAWQPSSLRPTRNIRVIELEVTPPYPFWTHLAPLENVHPSKIRFAVPK